MFILKPDLFQEGILTVRLSRENCAFSSKGNNVHWELANGICSQWYTKSRICHYMEVPDLDTEIIPTVQPWLCIPFPVLWTIPSFSWYYFLETEFLSLGAWYWLSKTYLVAQNINVPKISRCFISSMTVWWDINFFF